jgi:hypothetical protein
VRPAAEAQGRCGVLADAGPDVRIHLTLGLAGDEPRRDVLLADLVPGKDRRATAVEDQRDAVGMLGQLGDPVRHEDHDAPGVCQQVHASEEVERFLLGQGRVRLVEQEDPGVAGKCPSDLDALLDRERDFAQRAARVDEDRQVRHQLALIRIDVTGHEPCAFSTDHEVLGDRQVGEQLRLLVDDGDPTRIDAWIPR